MMNSIPVPVAGMKRRRSPDASVGTAKRHAAFPAIASAAFLLFLSGCGMTFMPDNSYRRSLASEADVLAAIGQDEDKIKQVQAMLQRFDFGIESNEPKKDQPMPEELPNVDLALDDKRKTLKLRVGNHTITYTYVSRVIQEIRNLYDWEEDDDDDFDVDDDDDIEEEVDESDDDAFVIDEDTLAHDIVLNMVVENLYMHAKGGSPPPYHSVFNAMGWGFDGIETLSELDDGGDLLNQVMTLTYPAKFTCVELDEEGKPIQEEQLPPGWAHPCYARFVPLLDVIDAPPLVPGMMHRHKRCVMDRFNTVHSAVKRKMEKDERLEAIRQAEAMRADRQSEG